MVSWGFKIVIFILVGENIASKYYYKKMDGTYDVYYGPRAIWGYKEFKSPKSYKTKFEDRGDRPGKCLPGDFPCNIPFRVKETEVFECEVDYQCPSHFKCCQADCFQHKICQPATTDEDEENEIPTASPKPSEDFTKLSTAKPDTTLEIESTTFHITGKPSELHSTTDKSLGTTKGFTTEKPITHTTGKPLTSPSTLSTFLETTRPSTTLKTEKPIAHTSSSPPSEKSTTQDKEKSSESHSTLVTTIETTTAVIKSTPKTHEITLETDKPFTQITEKYSKHHSTSSTQLGSTTIVNINTITDDEDLSFSGDDELDISTLDETSHSSTLKIKTTNVPVITSTLKPDSKPITTITANIKLSTTILPKSSSVDLKTTGKSSKKTTLEPSTEIMKNVPITTTLKSDSKPLTTTAKTTKVSATTLRNSSLKEKTTTVTSAKPTESPTRETTVTTETHLKSTKKYTETTNDKSSSSVQNALPSEERTTPVVDITSDDEDLIFSGDSEVNAENIDAASRKSSTVSDSSKITSKSTISAVESSISTVKALRTDTTTAGSSTTATEKITTITSVNSLKPESTSEKNINKNTHYIDSDDEDLVFSGDDAVKTTEIFETSTTLKPLDSFTKSTVSHTSVSQSKTTSVKNVQKPGDFHSTKVYGTTTEKLTGSPRYVTKTSTELDREGSKSNFPHTVNSLSSTTLLNTKSTSTTKGFVEDQTALTTEISRMQTGVTVDNKDISTKSSDGGLYFTTPESIISTSKDAITNGNIQSRTKVTSNFITEGNFKEGESVEEITTSNAINDTGNIPLGNSVNFANSLLQMLRKIPSVVIVEASSDDTDPYLYSFLGLLEKIPSVIKEGDSDSNIFVNDNKSSTEYETVTTDSDVTG